MIKSFKPDIVLIQLGSNDLTSETALRVGSSIDDFVWLLNNVYHVKVIYVCQTIMRQDQSAFNCKAKLLMKYLRVVLESVPYAHFWDHRGFWCPPYNIYVHDGVHLNPGGQGKFYHSLRRFFRGFELAYCFHLLIFPSKISRLREPQFYIFCTCLAMLLPFCCEPFIIFLLCTFYVIGRILLWLHTI